MRSKTKDDEIYEALFGHIDPLELELTKIEQALCTCAATGVTTAEGVIEWEPLRDPDCPRHGDLT